MVNGVVIFDVDLFKSLYPEFVDMDNAVLDWLFETSTDIVNNTLQSVVCDVCKRKRLLYLLTAHFATLRDRGGDIVGAISSASEGSTSVGYTNGNYPANAAFFSSTMYGQMFWQLSLPYRLGPVLVSGDECGCC